MKKKKLFISLLIVLSTVLFIGCSNTKTDTRQSSHKTHQKGGKAHKKAKNKIQKNSELLSFLGMTKTDFTTEHKSGKSIADIAKEKNKTEQQVIDFLVYQRGTAFKKNNPDISSDKLDTKKQQWTKKITKEVEKKPKNKKGA